eukprot:358842-Chlamydomonas_euryale.AAC.2
MLRLMPGVPAAASAAFGSVEDRPWASDWLRLRTAALSPRRTDGRIDDGSGNVREATVCAHSFGGGASPEASRRQRGGNVGWR